uniref:C2H2-type domain-containing protein n=1 Tax=Setaria digitata TaxID=48799 RepID=A0A915PJX9_9BILA
MEDEEPAAALIDYGGSWEQEEMAEWRQVPLYEPFFNEETVNVVPRARPAVAERNNETVREIVLCSRTARVPMMGKDEETLPVSPETFQTPAIEECGFCPKEFGTLKGWRIHTTKMHKQNGYCQKCGHFVDMPNATTAAGIQATMELILWNGVLKLRKRQ